jgi:ProP effector
MNGAIAPIELANALRFYCGNSFYLGNTRTGTSRIDLDGKPAGIVTEQESQAAKARLSARKAARVASKPPQPKSTSPETFIAG